MGRRSKGPFLDGTEPVEGIETVGKVFFEMPQVITVGKAEPEPNHYPYYNRQSSVSNNVITEDLKATVGKVRLLSSRNYQVCNTPPDEVEYRLSQLPMYTDCQEYLRIMRIAGFGVGAVVTRRFQSEWRYKGVSHWGIITFETGHPNSAQAWAPYTVKWFDAIGSATEKAWAEDLVVIHAHMDNAYLESMLEDQGIEFKLSKGRTF